MAPDQYRPPFLTGGITADEMPAAPPDRVVADAIEAVLHRHLVADPAECLRQITVALHDAGYVIGARPATTPRPSTLVVPELKA